MKRYYLLAGVTLAAVLFFLPRGVGQTQSAPRVPHWEYKVVLENELSRREENRITPTAARIEARLNRLGVAGWELAEVTGQNIYVFKRLAAKKSP